MFSSLTSASRWYTVALLSVLLLSAGLLRLAGIEHNLARAGPTYDEQNNFIAPIQRMLNRGTPNPTVYSGYAGAFNYLALAPVAVGRAVNGELGAYVAARGLVALFGVISVGLLYVLTVRLYGPAPALLAAGLLTFSRPDIRSAHYIHPDVLIGTAVLGLLALVAGRQLTNRRVIALGVLCGVATAVKYTGILLFPAAVASLLVEKRLRSGLPRLLLASGLAFAVVAPYALARVSSEGSGLGPSLEAYYAGFDWSQNRLLSGRGHAVRDVFDVLLLALGPAGLTLALLSPMARRQRKALVPAVVLLGVSFLAMAPATRVYPRHVLPTVAATAFLAGAGLCGLAEQLGRRTRHAATLAVAVVLAVLATSAARGMPLTFRYLETPSVTEAAEWIEGSTVGHTRVLTLLPFRFPLDPERFEVTAFEGKSRKKRRATLDRCLMGHYGMIAVAPASRGQSLAKRHRRVGFTFDDGDRSLAVLLTGGDSGCGSISAPAPSRVTSSEPDTGGAAWDGSRQTAWRSRPGNAHMVAEWAAPITVRRVEILAGAEAAAWSQDYYLEVHDGSGSWIHPPQSHIRPYNRRRQLPPYGQVFVLTAPVETTAIRITHEDRAAWSVAEVEVSSGAP